MQSKLIVKKSILGLLMLGTVTQITGCENMTKQDIGTLSGAAVGGVVGSTIGQGRGKILASYVGIAAGGMIGNAIGKHMDDLDKLKAQAAFENNKTNQSSQWKNPDSGVEYTVTPKKTYQASGQRYCREYVMTAMIAGKEQQTYGTACRQPDGTWKIKS